MKLSLRFPLVTAFATVLVVTAASALSSPPEPRSPSAAPRVAAIDTFHAVVREPARHARDLAAEYTVYRPADLRAVRGKLPVVVFGNGACRHTSNHVLIGTHVLLAAHGFLVVSVGGFGNPTYDEKGTPVPEVLLDGITWAERENRRADSPLRHRIDTKRVAVAGNSCGGLEALVAGADPRVTSVLSLNSGFFADGRYGYGRAEPAKLHAPVLFLDGGPTDQAHENTIANYDLVTVPAVRASNPSAGHSGFWYGVRNGDTDATIREEAVTTLVQWLDFTLNGDRAARAYFLGDACGLCGVPGWSVSAKNFRAGE
ncbi:hypothetical protein BAY59_14350 [Prauserella coralliicola]|nr:hypothetical protein BAY59_14350 [Prauserella coralliicola]